MASDPMSTSSCAATSSGVLVVQRTSTICSSSTIYRHLHLHIHLVRQTQHLDKKPELIVIDHASLEQVTQGPDPNQLIDTYVAPMASDPMYIVGPKPGPYVAEHSFNIYTRLGARIALLGIDARVEVCLRPSH